MESTKPTYYNLKEYSVFDVAESWRLGFHLFNVLKYVVRAYEKNGRNDIDKAIIYLERLQSLNSIPQTSYIRQEIEVSKLLTCWNQLKPRQHTIILLIYNLQAYIHTPKQIEKKFTLLFEELKKLKEEIPC